MAKHVKENEYGAFFLCNCGFDGLWRLGRLSLYLAQERLIPTSISANSEQVLASVGVDYKF